MSDVPKIIVDALADLTKAQERVMSLCDAARDVNDYLALDPMANAVCSPFSCVAHITVNTKDPARAIRFFRSLDYSRDTEKPLEMPEYGMRWWSMSLGDVKGCLQIQAILGDRCKRVQVGTKEEPVYEIQCAE